MKANELMLGDWVQNTNGNIGRVEGIIPHDDGHGPEIVVRYSPSGTAYSDVKVLRPIPLTPEILEKNGFNRQDFPGWRFSETGKYSVMWRKDYPNLLVIASFNREFGEFARFNINFVHELQHALRLCVIEKEIEL